MSWQLTSFLILAAVLLAGFAWYERSRPPSQVVALVATLAALAIAGRIAFAAFPNVKPTTDVVIFAGYALGPAPGFVVGALAGLVSNFWFGQGPWTPWQMAGWGLCGVLGAALALGTRNASRLTLAAACGFAGVAYGILLNFSLMASYGGDLSWQRFLALEARAVPFDAAHAIGNVALALLAGPAMVRMLVRFRERFEWGRREEAEKASLPAAPRQSLRSGSVAAILVLAFAPAIALPARADASDAGRAANWLESVQNADGGFGASPGDGSSAAMTGWAMLGLEAAGRNPLDVFRRGHTPVDLLRADEKEISSTGDLARTILALEGAGVNPRSFAGRDLVGELVKRRRKDDSFEGWPNDTAYSVIALRAAGATGGLDKSLEWLLSVQNDDGGWGDIARLAQHRRRHRRGDAGDAARLQGGQTAASPTCARPQRPAAASHSAAPARSTPSPPRGRSRASSQSAATRPPTAAAAAAPPTTWRPARRATATTAIRPPATRPQSGSPARSWSPPPASSFRSRSRPEPPSPSNPSSPRPRPAPYLPTSAQSAPRHRLRCRPLHQAQGGEAVAPPPNVLRPPDSPPPRRQLRASPAGGGEARKGSGAARRHRSRRGSRWKAAAAARRRGSRSGSDSPPEASLSAASSWLGRRFSW